MAPRSAHRRRPPRRPTCRDCGDLVEWARDVDRDVRRPLDPGAVDHGIPRYATRTAADGRLLCWPVVAGAGRRDHRDTCRLRLATSSPNPADPRAGHD